MRTAGPEIRGSLKPTSLGSTSFRGDRQGQAAHPTVHHPRAAETPSSGRSKPSCMG
jgi:hypothetical protein